MDGVMRKMRHGGDSGQEIFRVVLWVGAVWARRRREMWRCAIRDLRSSLLPRECVLISETITVVCR